ncbi:MAG TPA: DUF2127 domain-containing protein [Candidatus Paceibacterota bacterium]|nr:DUF2127 domain-containing protein [Candidatus Paceibacterota bacterium]
MPSNFKEKRIHDAFLLTVVIKGLDGVLEVALGALLTFTPFTTTLASAAFFLTRNEIVEDPDSFFATHLRALASQSHEAFVLGGLYLIAHGLVKTFLSVSLWRNYTWAYPAAMAFLGLFILFQIIRISVTGSIPLILLTFFDIGMFWLVWHEYKKWPHRT